MATDKVKVLHRGDYTLSVVKAGTERTPFYDFKLDESAFAMATLADKLYLTIFESPTVDCLSQIMTFLKGKCGELTVEIIVG